jgi:hypothetical protein
MLGWRQRLSCAPATRAGCLGSFVVRNAPGSWAGRMMAGHSARAACCGIDGGSDEPIGDHTGQPNGPPAVVMHPEQRTPAAVAVVR